ncbi:hypothetical protein [Parasphingorhabdus sp.]|uniref:hypothetical protein n=1 Tax=Parasphingorhabdus sp. TaxID=2709688 RepID=UPI002F94375B
MSLGCGDCRRNGLYALLPRDSGFLTSLPQLYTPLILDMELGMLVGLHQIS